MLAVPLGKTRGQQVEFQRERTSRRLNEHLLSFGIRRFRDEGYWSWGGKVLGPSRGSKLEELREPLMSGASPVQMKRFYDFIANEKVSAVVHSMKADAIRESGIVIEENLPESGRILDLGCSVGFLTTFYARQSQLRQMVGCDYSSSQIARARKEASRLGLENLRFESCDIQESLPQGEYDVVISSQTLCNIEDLPGSLAIIEKACHEGSLLLAVEALGTADDSIAFVEDVQKFGFGLLEVNWVFFSDLGERGVYPFFVFEKGGVPKKIDFEVHYSKALSRLGS